MHTPSPYEHGYLRHWLVAGPVETPYAGAMDCGDDAMRWAAIDPTIRSAPANPLCGSAGPDGMTWGVHDPQHNVFVDVSSFWYSLVHVNAWFASELHCESAMELPVWLWAAGCADLYCNGQHIARNNCPRYMYPKRQQVEIPLRAGMNHLAVRLQVLGLRDSRFLFGVQFLDPDAPVVARLPGGVSMQPPVKIESSEAGIAPMLPRHGSGQDFASRRRFHMQAITTGGEDVIAQHSPSSVLGSSKEAANWPKANVQKTAQGLLCARSIGIRHPYDEKRICEICDVVDERPDCADFALAALLRIVMLGFVTDAERARIKATALTFRYWKDESGSDAMCFTSENHRLLFHGCQLLAGRRWPEEMFSASGRNGAQQADIALDRCKEWLDAIEKKGFREYNSSGYIPITVAAMLNLVDGSGDEEVSRRAACLVDGIFRQLADHAFKGVVIAPQGRVYREVLSPEASGTQALLSYAVDEAVISHHIWLGFLCSSPDYLPPGNLLGHMNQPVSKAYRQNTADIILHKASDYVLTSTRVHSSEMPDLEDPGTDHDRPLAAGLHGYQQHLWQATLGVGCHVFVNHPGEWIDNGKARPGYWYGNGILPRTEQRENILLQIYNIHEEHPVPFVHAHWPTEAFDAVLVRDSWYAARKDTGYVGLWCSAPLEPHDQMLVGEELRAWSRKCAWICVCGATEEFPDLDSFMRYCLAVRPDFDSESCILRLAGKTELRWC